MKKCNFFFSTYESLKKHPVCFQWSRNPKLISIDPEECLYMGELMTIETKEQIPCNHVMILTKTKFIECADSFFKNPISAIAELPLNNPSLKKRKCGFRLKGYGGRMDFYCKTKEELDKWFENLSKICIMRHVREKYCIGELLGDGSFAKVYLATLRKNGIKFVAKMMEKDKLFQSVVNMRCVIKEIEVLRTLNHPNIVKLYEIYESPNYICLIMEYAKGEDLFTHLKNKGNYSEKDS